MIRRVCVNTTTATVTQLRAWFAVAPGGGGTHQQYDQAGQTLYGRGTVTCADDALFAAWVAAAPGNAGPSLAWSEWESEHIPLDIERKREGLTEYVGSLARIWACCAVVAGVVWAILYLGRAAFRRLTRPAV